MKPLVTFIIPTLNAEKLLDGCLSSVRSQDYPNIEILVADGGSTDGTIKIARKHGATLIENPERVAESGKRKALEQARGEIICFLDADNELTHDDIVQLAVEGLEKFPQVLGVESYYLASPRMSSFCGYMTETLHIGDPVSWMMSVKPLQVGDHEEFELWTFPKGSMAYPLGANGFFYRRSNLDSVGAASSFEDTHVALRLAKAGKVQWLRLKGRGVHHFLVHDPLEFIRKRRRQTYHFLSLQAKKRDGGSWTQENVACSPLVASLYCVSFFGPLFHCIKGLVQSGDLRWIWHLAACPASVIGLAWGVLTFWSAPRTADREAALQPRRK